VGYYQGDFYAGARGDPFWGSLIGIARRGLGALLGGSVGGGARTPVVGKVMGAGRAIMERGKAQIIKHPVLSAAGAAGVVGAAVGAEGQHLLAGGGAACPKGHHICKSKHAKHFGMCVRNRRMNVANGRALGRAVRRLHHFARKYRKVVGFVSPRKPKGRMYFRKKKRAA
jgi:hypothetical protein